MSKSLSPVAAATKRRIVWRLIGLRWASDDPLVEGLDYHLEGDGRWVFSAWYLLKRGACCESGCRHCPYGFEVP